MLEVRKGKRIKDRKMEAIRKMESNETAGGVREKTGIHGGDIYRNHVKLDFSVNVNPLGIPDAVTEALHSAVERCGEYPDIAAQALKKAVADMLSVPEDWLLFGNGASELFMGIVHALRPGKTVLAVPSFYGYEHAAKAVDSTIVSYPLKEENGFALDDGFLERLTKDVDLLFLANPNNPTGRLTERGYLERVLGLCQEKGIWTVLDECFIEFCGGGRSMLPQTGEYGRLLVVRAFTKSFAIPGVRLGYLACSNPVAMGKIAGQLPEWNLSSFAQAAGIACTEQREFLTGTAAFVEKERWFLAEGLERLGLRVIPSAANFLLIRSRVPLYEELLSQGILIRDCGNFRGLTEGYYRVAVKRREQNEILLNAMEKCLGKNREKCRYLS